MDPLFCLFCARSNPADARFCNECGTPLDLKPCRQCDAVNPRVADRCYRCEAALPVEATARAAAARAEAGGAESTPAMPEVPAADVVAQAGGALAALERGWQSTPAPVAGNAFEGAERMRGRTQQPADGAAAPPPSTALPVEHAVAQATPTEVFETSGSAPPPPWSATVRKRAVVPGSAPFERGASRQHSPLTPSGARPLSPGPHAHAYPAREADVAPMADAPVALAWAPDAVSTTGTTPWLADDHAVAQVSNDGAAETPVAAAAVDAAGTLDDQRGPEALPAGHAPAPDDARWRVDPERLPDVDAIAPASPGSPVYAPRRARVLPAVLLLLLVGFAAAAVYLTQDPERLESLTQRARDVVRSPASAPATSDASTAAPPASAVTSPSGEASTPASAPAAALAPTSPTLDAPGSDATSSTTVARPPADAAGAPASTDTPPPAPASTAATGGPPPDASPPVTREPVAASKAASRGRTDARATTTRPSRPAQRAPAAEPSRPPSQAAPRSPSPDAPRAPCTPAVAALGLC
jgi:hypothetical protein